MLFTIKTVTQAISFNGQIDVIKQGKIKWNCLQAKWQGSRLSSNQIKRHMLL